jgi:hypothetical protein
MRPFSSFEVLSVPLRLCVQRLCRNGGERREACRNRRKTMEKLGMCVALRDGSDIGIDYLEHSN